MRRRFHHCLEPRRVILAYWDRLQIRRGYGHDTCASTPPTGPSQSPPISARKGELQPSHPLNPHSQVVHGLEIAHIGYVTRSNHLHRWKRRLNQHQPYETSFRNGPFRLSRDHTRSPRLPRSGGEFSFVQFLSDRLRPETQEHLLQAFRRYPLKAIANTGPHTDDRKPTYLCLIYLELG